MECDRPALETDHRSECIALYGATVILASRWNMPGMKVFGHLSNESIETALHEAIGHLVRLKWETNNDAAFLGLLAFVRTEAKTEKALDSIVRFVECRAWMS